MNFAIARKLAIWLLWLGFAIYAFRFSPPDHPDTFELIARLSTGQFAGINPLIIALFNIMGVWPLIYCALLFFDGKGQPVKAWPFAIAAFAVGAFALLPYLALRHPNPTFSGPKKRWLRFWESRWLGVGLAIAAIGLSLYGITQGDWADFAAQWQQKRFIHVMSLDFCLLCLLFPALLPNDMARRQIKNPLLFWLIASLPLIGPTIYLIARPPVPLEHPTPQPVSASASAPVP